VTTKPMLLDAALAVLRAGETLTIDAVAREAGMTKPGVVHHFATKEVLTLAVLEHQLDLWEAEILARAGADASAEDRLLAYVEHTLLGDMDTSDLVLLADPKLRHKLPERWADRMNTWFGHLDEPHLTAVRLIADGAWINRCLGLLDMDEEIRSATVALASELLQKGTNL